MISQVITKAGLIDGNKSVLLCRHIDFALIPHDRKPQISF